MPRHPPRLASKGVKRHDHSPATVLSLFLNVASHIQQHDMILCKAVSKLKFHGSETMNAIEMSGVLISIAFFVSEPWNFCLKRPCIKLRYAVQPLYEAGHIQK